MNGTGPKFKIGRIFPHQTEAPITERILFQFSEILDSGLIELPKPKIEEVKLNLLECMKKLIMVEEAKNSYLTMEKEAIERLGTQKGVKILPHGFRYDDPTENLKKHVEDFLIRCIIAIRKIVKIAEIIFDKEFGDNPNNLRRHLCTLFSNSSDEKKMIEHYSVSIAELYRLRGDSEHTDLGFLPFEFDIANDKSSLIKLPRLLLEGKMVIVRRYLKDAFNNCFGFCQDITALCLGTRCSKLVRIATIPEGLRHEHKHFKYELDLNEECKKRFLEAVKKEENATNNS